MGILSDIRVRQPASGDLVGRQFTVAGIGAGFEGTIGIRLLNRNGKVIATSGTIGKKGAPTFEGIIVNAKWAEANEPFMIAFVKALNRANEEYKASGKGWTADSAQTKAMAKWTKANPADVGPAMALYTFPTLAEQVSPAWLGGGAAKAMAHTAAFLKEQGRVQEVKPDYSAFVTTAYVQKAMGK